MRLMYPAAAVVLTGAAILLMVWSVVQACGGMFIYPLDDVYIHLSLAETILDGGYGVNAGEYASPASSIVYPYLVAGMLALGFGDIGPLLLACAAALGAAWLIGRAFCAQLPTDRAASTVDLLLLVLTLAAVNLFALPLTGLEHTLHILAALMIVTGLVRLADDHRVSAVLVAGIIATPLIRFEGLALALAALAAMALARHRRAALGIGLTLLAALLAYGLLMTRLGLPVLPSSVLVKSPISASTLDGNVIGSVRQMAGNLGHTLRLRDLVAVTVGLGLLLLAMAAAGPDRRRALLVGAPVAAALVAQVLAGQFGWFFRYEVYAVAIAIAAIFHIAGPGLAASGIDPWLRRAGVAVLLSVPAAWYLVPVLWTPAASNDIYTEQYQMHRFATEFFPHAVAVNDLGWTSYRNDAYVLDLWGLGSEEARTARQSGGFTRDKVAALAAEKHVVFAMIYDSWLGDSVPETWCILASLDGPEIVDQWGAVDFHLVDPAYRAEMEQALDRFAPTLPAGATLSRHDCPPA